MYINTPTIHTSPHVRTRRLRDFYTYLHFTSDSATGVLRDEGTRIIERKEGLIGS